MQPLSSPRSSLAIFTLTYPTCPVWGVRLCWRHSHWSTPGRKGPVYMVSWSLRRMGVPWPKLSKYTKVRTLTTLWQHFDNSPRWTLVALCIWFSALRQGSGVWLSSTEYVTVQNTFSGERRVDKAILWIHSAVPAALPSPSRLLTLKITSFQSLTIQTCWNVYIPGHQDNFIRPPLFCAEFWIIPISYFIWANENSSAIFIHYAFTQLFSHSLQLGHIEFVGLAGFCSCGLPKCWGMAQ